MKYERIHVIGFQALFVEQLSEAWYKEGVAIVERLSDPANPGRDESYPPLLHVPQFHPPPTRPDTRGPALAAGLGGTFSREKWSNNPLGLSTSALEASGRGVDRGSSSRLDQERAQHDAAQIRTEAFAAHEAKLQAEGQLREMARKTDDLKEMLRLQTEQAAVLKQLGEARKANIRPSHSRPRERKSEKRRRSRHSESESQRSRKSRRKEQSRGRSRN